MKRSVIVGANRGIGLELTKSLVKRGDIVIAACRESSEELSRVGCHSIVEQVDVTDRTSLNALSACIGAERVDELWLVAGIMQRTSLSELNEDVLLQQFRVNAIGPLVTVAALRSNLGNGSKVGILTSRMGSIADNTSGGSYGYRMSKTAVNSAGKSLALDLRDDGIAVALLHPGWVQTEMTGGTGHVTAAESAAGLMEQMGALTLGTSGSFVHANGEQLPW